MTCSSHLWRRAVLLLAAVGLIVFATSCDGFFVSESSIQSVTARPSTVLLKTGDTPADSYPLTSSATTVGGTSRDDTATATWTSDNTGVATVSQGLVTAVGPGTARITAKDGGATSNTVNVMTYSVPTPSSLTITTPAGFAVSGAAPGTYQFRAFLGPDTSFPEITNFVDWSSDTTNAATVNTTNARGVVTVLSIGTPTTVKITATANVGAPGATMAPTPVTGTLSFTAD